MVLQRPVELAPVIDIYPAEHKISGEHVQFDGRAGAIIQLPAKPILDNFRRL